MTVFLLKLIAVISMLIDHMGHVLFPEYISLRYIGRLAFPIYAFLIVEGFLHTGNLRRYMLRLFMCGIISEVPFDLAFYESLFYVKKQNTFWTLLLGLAAVFVMSLIRNENRYARLALRLAAAAPFAVAAQLINSDYRWVGVSLIACMYLFHDEEIFKVASGLFLMMPPFTNGIEYVGALAFLPMHFYNGRKGGPGGAAGRVMQTAFYLFYPVHLLTLALIRDGLWSL